MSDKNVTVDSTDAVYMGKALELARRGLFSTRPNPRVGCVVVKNDKVIAEGWHQKAGDHHAEVYALMHAGADASDATLYVTLEPCSYYGKTPPCARSVAKAGLKRVVIAMRDPNPLVAGQGIAYLQAQGIEVIVGVLEREARELNVGYISRMERGRPWVRCKLAMSLDGRTALSSGESKWITGESARGDVQRLRARSCAIVTGVGTIEHDNPSMNVRHDQMAVDFNHYAYPIPPLRVILDSRLRALPQMKLLTHPGEVLIATTAADHSVSKWRDVPSVTVVQTRSSAAGVDPDAVIAMLSSRAINEVLIEAGACLCASFLKAGLIDELWVYVAPKLIGNSSRNLFDLAEVDSLQNAHQLALHEVCSMGDDVRLVYKTG
ncbi:MAG: bifunctional diaminohydroxyphosphoribosylaminopyrimidine deaminase/5-amino-6-(5-phosphoribosylamino)uracil reductase RibD [Pseudomonadota bacterium]|nr:bifunctional diaminohydroxyphosphoribosylaminopyrimidine deaminase/5-amino-6-(5-phosphoribosylamino)uracil reductase RibD [Pseudomonadota bacterium]